MVSAISRSYSKENSLFGFFKRSKTEAIDPNVSAGLAKLPSLAVPRPNPSAAGLVPIWDLFQDDQSGLGVVVLKDGSYRCCYELDGVHVSGFDEARLSTLMTHFTGFLNSTYGGHPTKLFDLIPTPQILPKDKGLSDLFGTLHLAGQWAIYALILLHLGGVVLHAIWGRDGVLGRMLPASATEPAEPI